MYTIQSVLLRNNRQWELKDFSNVLAPSAESIDLENRLTVSTATVSRYCTVIDYYTITDPAAIPYLFASIPATISTVSLIVPYNFTDAELISVDDVFDPLFPTEPQTLRTRLHTQFPLLTDLDIDNLFAQIKSNITIARIATITCSALNITMADYLVVITDLLNLTILGVQSLIKVVDPTKYTNIKTLDLYSNLLVRNIIEDNEYVLIDLLEVGTSNLRQFRLMDFPHIYTLDVTTRLLNYFTNYNGYIPEEVLPRRNILNPKKVTYHDLFVFGLDAERTINDNTIIAKNPNHLPDLTITRKSHFPNSLQSLSTKILYTINGNIVFPTIVNDVGYITDGAVMLDWYDEQHLSVIDFSQLGDFTLQHFTNTNVTVVSHTRRKAVIRVATTVNLKTVTPLLIMNGRLHILNPTYEVLSSNEVGIRLDYLNMIDELKGVNTKTVSWIEAVDNLGNGYDIESIDPLKYLTDTDSALLFLPTTELSILKTHLNRTGFVGKYGCGKVPTGIIFLEDGSIGDYAVTEVTHYGNEVSVTKPKLLNDLKRKTVDQIDRGYDFDTYVSIRGVNNTSMMLPTQESMATVVDLYTI